MNALYQKAYCEGYTSKFHRNPYLPGTVQYIAWEQGYRLKKKPA